MRKARKRQATGRKKFFYIKPQFMWFDAKVSILLAVCN